MIDKQFFQGASRCLLQGHSEGGGLPGLDHRDRREGQQVSWSWQTSHSHVHNFILTSLKHQDCEDHRQAKGDRGSSQGEGGRAVVVEGRDFHLLQENIYNLHIPFLLWLNRPFLLEQTIKVTGTGEKRTNLLKIMVKVRILVTSVSYVGYKLPLSLNWSQTLKSSADFSPPLPSQSVRHHESCRFLRIVYYRSHYSLHMYWWITIVNV